jgi:prepilin-type N-terminal cleavage/methylation domain-containing protein
MRARGFTLIELLTVITIIGVLTILVLISLNNTRARGRDGKRVSDFREIQKALEAYAGDHNGLYPSTSGAWRTGLAGCGGGGLGYGASGYIPGLVPTYMPQLPEDPLAVGLGGAGGRCYQYKSDGSNYKLLDGGLIESLPANYSMVDTGTQATAIGTAMGQSISVHSDGATSW